MPPQQIVEWYTQRWSLDTSFQACRASLRLASTKGYCQRTVLRLPPCFFGLYTLVVLLSLQLPGACRGPGAVVWPGTATVTFSDMLTCVRRAVWQQWFFHTPR
jgi:hypothetical protein